ncbi:MAG: LiaF transmembrane domain-containing protein [Eubacterium sp.]
MKKDNIFWGVLLLLGAVYILAHSLGYTPDISLVRIVIGVICVMSFIKSALRMEFFGMLFSLAVLLIVFDHVLGIEALTPWPVLGAAILGSIGLDMIFGSRARAYRNRKAHRNINMKNEGAVDVDTSQVEGDSVVISGLFNGTKKNINSNAFKKAFIDCKFCGMEVNMDNAIIQSGSAVVDLSVHFSGVEIYIPSNWHVVNNTDCSFGSVEEHHVNGVAEDGPTLVLQGNVRFSGVEIYRI